MSADFKRPRRVAFALLSLAIVSLGCPDEREPREDRGGQTILDAGVGDVRGAGDSRGADAAGTDRFGLDTARPDTPRADSFGTDTSAMDASADGPTPPQGALGLAGAWPHHANTRSGAFAQTTLASAYRVTGGGAAGPFESAPCMDGCSENCGVRIPHNPGSLVRVVAGSGERIFVLAGLIQDRRLFALSASGQLSGLAEVELPDGSAEGSLLDILFVEERDGGRGHLIVFSEHNLISLDPDTYQLRWKINLVEPGVSVRLSPTGSFVVLTTAQTLIEADLPGDGDETVSRMINLETEGRTEVIMFELDDFGRIYALMNDYLPAPDCSDVAWQHPLVRLRVFGAPVFRSGVHPAFREQSDAPLLMEHNELADAYFMLGWLQVERAMEITETVSYRASVIGRTPPAERCLAPKLYSMRSPDHFSDDPRDPRACPSKYQQACTTGSGFCPCAGGCGSMLQICVGPIVFEDGNPETTSGWKHNMVDTFTYRVEAPGSMALSHRNTILLPRIEHPLASNQHGLAYGAGAVLNLAARSGVDNIVVAGHGIFGPALAGRDVDNPENSSWRFAHARSDMAFHLEQGTADRYDRLRIGALGNRQSSSSTLLRHRLYEGSYGYWRSDMVPLSGGRLLSITGDYGGSGNSLDLRLLSPSTQMWHGYQIQPAADGEIPEVCASGPGCFYPLGLNVSWDEVYVDGPPEIWCGDDGCSQYMYDRLNDELDNEGLAFAYRGSTDLTCTNPNVDTRVRMVNEEPRTTYYLQCEGWSENFRKSGRKLGTVELWDRIRACDEFGQPVPWRLFRSIYRDPEVHILDEQGEPVDDIAEGDTFYLSVATDGEVEITIEGQGGVFQATEEGGSLTVSGDQPVGVTATGAGLISFAIRVVLADGRTINLEVVVIVEGPRSCSEHDGTFSACDVAPPYALPTGAADFEAAQAPATAGEGVLLHNMSLLTQAVDLTVSSPGMDMSFERTYRSAHLPYGGGPLGGWAFSYDQRLTRFYAGDQLELGAPLCLGEDVAGSADLRIALADGTGRLDFFGPASSSSEVTYAASGSPEDLFLVYDHQAGNLEAAAFTARVTEYVSAPGLLSKLRGYTILAQAGERVKDLHPYYKVGGSVGSYDSRFYELTLADGRRKIFNCSGQLIRVIDRNFREVELIYKGGNDPHSGRRLLSQIFDSSGRPYQIRWAHAGQDPYYLPRIASITDFSGREVLYSYEDHPLLGAVLSRVSHAFYHREAALNVLQEWVYAYDESGHLTTIHGPDGQRELLTTYVDGVVTQQITGGGEGECPHTKEAAECARWSFSATQNTVVVTDPRDVVWTYELQPLDQGGALVIASEQVQVDLFDGVASAPSNRSSTSTTSWTYNDVGLPATIIHPEGRQESLTYDSLGNLVSWTETPANGLGGQTRTRSWEYDPVCQTPLREVDDTGRETLYTLYDFDLAAPGHHCQTASIAHAPVPGRADQAADVAWEESFEIVASGPLRGLPSAIELSRSGTVIRRTELTYDDAADSYNPEPSPAGQLRRNHLGHPRTKVVSGATPQRCQGDMPNALTTSYLTDRSGNILEERISGSDGDMVTTYAYDRKDRKILEVRDPDGLAVAIRYEYNAAGQLERELKEVTDHFTNANVPAGVDHTQVTRTVYDKARRPFATLVYSPDGPAGAAAEIHGLDPNGNAVWTITPGPGASGFDESAMTTFLTNEAPTPAAAYTTFPVEGYPANFDDQSGAHFLLIKQTFDSLNRLTQKTTTDGRPAWTSSSRPSDTDPFVHTINERTFYDIAGNTVLLDRGRTDLMGAYTHRVYNGNRHLVSDRVLDPACTDGWPLHETRHQGIRPDGQPTVVEVYGPAGDAVEVTGAVPTKCADATLVASTELEYDAWGRVAVSRQQIFPVASTGLLDTHTPDVRVLASTRDFEGRETSSTSQYGGHTFSDYTFFGELCAVSDVQPTSLAMTWRSGRSFDALGRVTQISEAHFATGQTAPTYTVAKQLQRDSLGRVTRETTGAGLVTHKMYDALGRQRVAFEPGAPDPFATTMGYGHFVITAHDALGRPVRSTHLLTTEVGQEVRERSIAYRGAFASQEVVTSTAGESLTTRKVYDAAGRVVRSEPHGDGAVETTIYNEAGHMIQQVRANNTASHVATVSHTVDGQGLATEVTAVNGALTDQVTMRYNGLGLPFYIKTTSDGIFDLAIADRDSTVVRIYNSVGDILQETSSTLDVIYASGGDVSELIPGTTTLRAQYHPSGRPRAIYFDGASRDSPDLTYVFDFHDRVVEIIAPANREVFADAFRLRYNYIGHLLASRDNVGSFVTTYDYNEHGDRHRLRHYRGTEAIPSAQIYESRRYWHGRHLAATTAFPVRDGQEQGAIATPLENLRRGGTASHLTVWPAGVIEPATYPFYPDNIWPSTYALYEKNGFGDTFRTVTYTWPAFSGRPTVNFKYALFAEGGWTLERESTISWLAAEDPDLDFAAGTILEWREGILSYGANRINGSIQNIAREPEMDPELLTILPTMPPNLVESSRSYDVSHDQTGALLAYGLDETDPLATGHSPNRYIYDGFGRLVESLDGQTEVYMGSISQVGLVPRSEEHVVTYDGLHRRHREVFTRNAQTGAFGSKLPSERDRHFAYIGDQLLEETNDAFGTTVRDRFMYGPAGDLPCVDLHHGEYTLLEDINGSFVVVYNQSTGAYSALHTASGAPVDLKGQPYIIDEQKLADQLSGGVLALLGDWMTIPFAVERDGGTFFRRLNANTELASFEGVTYTQGRGFTFGLAPHPHYAHEMARMTEIDQTNALIIEGVILVASMVVPYFGVWAVFAFDLATSGVETAVLGLIPGLGPAGKALHAISKGGSVGKAYNSVKGLSGIPGTLGGFYRSMRSLDLSYASVLKARKSALAVKGIPKKITGAWGDVVAARGDLLRYGGWLQHGSGGSWRQAYKMARTQFGGYLRGKNQFMPAVREVSKRVRPRSLVDMSRIPVHILRTTPLPAKKLRMSASIKKRIWADPTTPFDDLLSEDNLESYRNFLEKYRPVHGTSQAVGSAQDYFKQQTTHGFLP